MSTANTLPFADAATIVRAHQKDAYFETSLQERIQDALHVFRGSRFVNTHPTEIAVGAKALYLALTTLAGARTLGEEYVDLLYVNRRGTRFPKLAVRALFVASYALGPYVVAKAVRWWQRCRSDDDLWLLYLQTLDTVMNIHIAVFYFEGRYYLLSKRLLGMRYAFGHNKDASKLASLGNYSFLGALVLMQFFVKLVLKLKQYNDERVGPKAPSKGALAQGYTSVGALEEAGKKAAVYDISLAAGALPYIPAASRDCMLCLSPMTNPAAARCGHFFCWRCIVDWVREHPECPLCRQQCLEQNLLPLR